MQNNEFSKKAITAYQQEDFFRCLKFARKSLKAGNRNPTDYEILAVAEVATGKQLCAVKTLRQGLKTHPYWTIGALKGAEIAYNCERYNLAEEFLKHPSLKNSENPEYLFSAAELWMKLENYMKASELLSKTCKLAPQHAAPLVLLGNCARNESAFHLAETYYRQAFEIDKMMLPALLNLSAVLIESEKYCDAIETTSHLIKIAPSDPENWYMQGIALARSKAHSRASDCFFKALSLQPNSPRFWTNYILSCQRSGRSKEALKEVQAKGIDLRASWAYTMRYALLMCSFGKYQEASAVCEMYLDGNSKNSAPLAVKYFCLTEQSALDEAKSITDLDKMIYVTRLKKPTPHGSIRDFISDLTEYSSNHPSMVFSPDDHATRNGYHSSDLFKGDKSNGIMTALREQITASVRSYLKHVEFPEGHRYKSAPEVNDLSIACWAVKMDRQGYQEAHIHPESWLSGVCYINLPTIISPSDKNREGWIEFGPAPDDYFAKNYQPRRQIMPELGKMIIFPSYFYHRTIPYSSDEPRISIAFDVIPC